MGTATTTQKIWYPASYWKGTVFIYCGGRVSKEEKQDIVHARIGDNVDANESDSNSTTGESGKNRDENEGNVDNRTNTTTSTTATLKKVSDYAFNCCTSLQTVLFCKSIESIGIYSFRHCRDLVTINLQPTSVRMIGFGTFYGCTNLMNIYFSNQTEEIGESTFQGCTSLICVELPPSLRIIRKGCFEGCANLSVVDLQSTNVQIIGMAAFRRCFDLTTIKFSNNVEEIKSDAFYKCSSIRTIHLPKSITKIGAGAFVFCNKLESINLQSTSIDTIGEHAFYSCSNLITVSNMSSNEIHDENDENNNKNGTSSTGIYSTHLPSSLVKVGTSAFCGCHNLPSILTTNFIHFECDLNRGGRRYLQRNDHPSRSDSDPSQIFDYPSSLWPYIMNRIINEMILPNQKFRKYDDNLSSYTDVKPIRRASVVYYSMIHGIAMDL